MSEWACLPVPSIAHHQSIADNQNLSLAYAEMLLILARIIFSFDMQIADQSSNWLDNQKNFNFWEKPSLRVHLAAARD